MIPLPPLEEQRRIVDILNRAARIEALRARAAERLREFVPALFVKMFGDPVENPNGWHSKKLGSLGTLDRGRSRHRPRNAPELYGGPYPFVQTGDIANSSGLVTQVLANIFRNWSGSEQTMAFWNALYHHCSKYRYDGNSYV